MAVLVRLAFGWHVDDANAVVAAELAPVAQLLTAVCVQISCVQYCSAALKSICCLQWCEGVRSHPRGCPPPSTLSLSLMDNSRAFVPVSSFMGAQLRERPMRCRRVAGRQVATAVLDTPASNTYLQRHAEVALRNFLTRRAVNTAMYYMHELGDSMTRSWLKTFDDFSEKVQQDRFVDADDYLQRMMRAEKETKTISISHLGGRLVRTYDIVIEPYRIAKRIFAIRKQLSGEWANDLKCIRMENLEIQRMTVESMLCSDDNQLQSKRNLIFDSDPFSTDNTPLRYKNYHALKTLTTRHAVSRLLPYIRDCGPNHDYMYLLQFCKAYGSIDDGDDFIRKLMAKPMENRTHPSHLIQPRSLALQILELRWVVAEEWIAIMKFIPEEHMLMNRSILERSVLMDIDSDSVAENDNTPC